MFAGVEIPSTNSKSVVDPLVPISRSVYSLASRIRRRGQRQKNAFRRHAHKMRAEDRRRDNMVMGVRG